MRKLVGSALLLALSATLAVAAPRQDRDDEHEKHERHDRGRHLGWYKHHDDDRDEHGDWDYDGDRIEPGRYYPHGRFESNRQKFVLVSVNYGTRRVILDDHSTWVVAPYDVDHCRDWRWDRDNVQVYDDDIHPGWYVLFNARLGQHIHVEYFGR